MRTSRKYLGFDDRWLMLLGIPLCGLLVELLIFGTHRVSENIIPCSVIGMIYTAVYWVTFRWVLINYHKQYPGYEFTSKRLAYILIRLILVYFIVKFSVGFMLHITLPEHVAFYNENKVSPVISEISELLLAALIFFIYEGIYYFNKSRQIEIEKNKLERITAEQKLSTLKNQVNPHFLFNSLNTLVTMIPEEPDLAINFVQKLSKTYRNILELRDEKLITIGSELLALDSYIYLLKTRFHGKIHIYNNIPSEVNDHFILPLSLQILIENAVKHNITSSSKPLKIELYLDNDNIVVRNNLQKKNQTYNSTKMGLENIRSRYKLLADKNIIVQKDDNHFTIHLPIIKNTLHANTDS